MNTRFPAVFALTSSLTLAATPHTGALAQQPAELRGTWVTTTANTAIATPENSAATMKRLRDIGLNTVFVETWKNGYTQYPSHVLKRTIGVDRRPALMPQDPSDDPTKLKGEGRDLLQETLIEAHRNQLLYIAWFEYGFMAAHKSTDNHLRRMKKDWLSLDQQGNEVAPNGFVWMNPLHPEARQFLLDLVVEAVQNYDLDGVQLDDRIVWPYYTMGYDDFTKKVYADEHNGKLPPADPKDPAWMRWRANKINEYAETFVRGVRAARPGIIISLSPAVYPWCYDNYLLEWPKWAAWKPGDSTNRWWDEFIPQVYRMNYPAFETTWLDQIKHLDQLGGGRSTRDLIAGIRVVGDGPDSSWEDLQKSITLVRRTGGGGHVHWFSRGVLDLYPDQLKTFYNGQAPHPDRPADWRPAPIRFTGDTRPTADWFAPASHRLILNRDNIWTQVATIAHADDRLTFTIGSGSDARTQSITLSALAPAPSKPAESAPGEPRFKPIGEMPDLRPKKQAEPAPAAGQATVDLGQGLELIVTADKGGPADARRVRFALSPKQPDAKPIGDLTAGVRPALPEAELLLDRRPDMQRPITPAR
jgi:uncharacterized lipoprotein YddW (UPF0748 family)